MIDIRRSWTFAALLSLLVSLVVSAVASAAHAGEPSAGDAAAALAEAYPDFITVDDQHQPRWRDGTPLPLGAARSFDAVPKALADASVLEQFHYVYPLGPWDPKVLPEEDPGRLRNTAFFTRMYGDCHRRGGVQKSLRTVVWLPKTAPQRLQVTTINGIDRQVEQLSAEIEALPPVARSAATQLAGGFACRNIAGTSLPSMHAYGAAMDLKSAVGRYWQWSGLSPASRKVNLVPQQLIDLFEKHGFIWGGKWYHYDTMHFEYRPELLLYAKRRATAPDHILEDHPL